MKFDVKRLGGNHIEGRREGGERTLRCERAKSNKKLRDLEKSANGKTRMG